ncbi:MAG: flavodoxin family protein [Chitinivibrionia bacterium]|nr:flavodoxin family protein [Chitinivibrionia bacterium]
MKVLLVNGSPHLVGCTNRALREIEKELQIQGISSQVCQLGTELIAGCRGCSYCKSHPSCVVKDIVNEFSVLAKSADGFIFGSPVYYAGASGSITSFMDRLFYSAGGNLQYKPAAAIVSCRRGGATAAFDQLNKYFTINNMPIVSSQYWNMVHGNTPEEVEQDLEGLQTMRVLAQNMAWLLNCIEAGKKSGIEPPQKENVRQRTNFIR